LSWRITRCRAASRMRHLLKVQPDQVGSFDHAATDYVSGSSKATAGSPAHSMFKSFRTQPTQGAQEQGPPMVPERHHQPVTGPARVRSVPPSSPRPSTHSTSDEPLRAANPADQIPAKREELDPRTVDALGGGSALCRVNATTTYVVCARKRHVTRTRASTQASDFPRRTKQEIPTPIPVANRTPCDTRQSSRHRRAARNVGESPCYSGLQRVPFRESLSRPPARNTIRFTQAAMEGPSPISTPSRQPRTPGFELRHGGHQSAYEVNGKNAATTPFT